ncbi:MAG: GIY-YIG nuclease family protein [Candidatus Kapabacteria bacterium]|nr:GIY-YIG nuclease family protein [Bacteroidota bacterium]MBL8000273.1 GIY-YIG nuclease family protein [Candidatus Kapabacteria bacterium]
MPGEEIIFIYVLSNSFNAEKYVGISKSPETRLKQHNSGTNRYTKAFIPWTIIYLESAVSWEAARKREKYLKSAAGKRFLVKQINSD